MIRLLSLTAFVASLTLITPGNAAAAGPCLSQAGTQQDGYNVGVTCSTAGQSGAPTTSSSSSNSSVTYAYEPACVRGSGISSDGFYGCGEQQTCGDDGLLYSVIAVDGDESTPQGFTCVEPGESAPAAVLTPGRILEAFRRVDVPSAPIGVNPVGGRTLVNFDTILHTQARPFTATVQLLGRRVTFDIEPAEFTWRTGQGDGFTTSDPGQPYRASLPMSAYVTHRYLRAGDVQLGLDTTWTARWRVGDGPWRPVDGTVTTSSDPVALEVVTARPQLVSYD